MSEEGPKFSFNVNLDNEQETLIKNIVDLVKAIGDMKDDEDRKKNNKLVYDVILDNLMGIREYFLKGNMHMFMTSGFNAETEIPFYDPDVKEVVKVTMKDIEFTFGKNIPIEENEMNSIMNYIKEEQKIVKDAPMISEEAKDKLKARGFLCL